MNSLYDDDIDEFDSIDVKSKKKEIKEESKSYNRKILDKCISIILETIYYLVFFIYKVIKWAVLGTVLVATIVGAVIATDVIKELNSEYVIAKYDIEKHPIKSTVESKPSYIYDKDNNLIVKLSSGEESKSISYKELPENVVNAMVAVEDRNFFSHSGIDLKGIIRVMYNFAESDGADKAGASTITQQLMRNSYITKEVTLSRKIKEICYSLAYEETHTKEDIFEKYINNIYFGNGYYGIETAANGYFGKTIKDCSLSEIAYLCALPNRPNYFNPYKNKYNAYNRKNKILQNMYELGYIDEDTLNKAMAEEIEIVSKKDDAYVNKFDSAFSSYATYCAVEELMRLDEFNFEYQWDSMDSYKSYKETYEDEYELMLEELKKGGYNVYTSLDSDAQDILQNALDEKLDKLDTSTNEDGMYNLQGSITCIDNKTNLVSAILSGRKQDDIQNYYNRGYQAYRQPGSSIKPLIVYTPALCAGFNSNSTVKNIDINKFRETGEQIGTDYTLENAVVWSRNGCAYYLLNMIGPETGLSYLNRMEFNRVVPDDYYLSSALGGLTYGTTTCEMASAYNCIYNSGVFTRPSCIMYMNKGDVKVYSYENEDTTQVYSSESCRTMINIMKKVVSEGTARGMKWNNSICEAAGKTGTTNDNKDGWFCGITPYYSMAVWIGYDNPKTLNNLQGGTYPTEVWKEAMESLIEDKLSKGEIEEGKSWNELKVYNEVQDIDSDELLQGRDDNEILSDGYTVGDYRRDYGIANEVNKMIEALNSLDNNAISEINNKINSIKGQTCKGKVMNNLNNKLSTLQNTVEQESISTETADESSENGDMSTETSDGSSEKEDSLTDTSSEDIENSGTNQVNGSEIINIE